MATTKKRQIQAALERKRLKQVELADSTGLTPSFVSLVCLGKSEPKVSDAIRMARGIGEPVESLFSDFVESN